MTQVKQNQKQPGVDNNNDMPQSMLQQFEKVSREMNMEEKHKEIQNTFKEISEHTQDIQLVKGPQMRRLRSKNSFNHKRPHST